MRHPSNTTATLIYLVGFLLVTGCGSSQDQGANGGHSPRTAIDGLTLYLAAPTAAVEPRTPGTSALAPPMNATALRSLLQELPAPAGSASEPCSPLRGTSGPTPGLCVTPDNLHGWASAVTLGGSLGQPSSGGTPQPSQCGPGRLLAVNSFEDSGQTKRSGGVFDLNDPIPVGGNAALDCDEYLSTLWQTVSVHFSYLDASVHVPAGKLAVRFVFEPNPLTEEATFSEPSCGLDEHYVQDQLFLPAEVRVQRGDVLVCLESNPEEGCSDADYQWLDLDTQQFVATRPANPYQLDYMTRLSVGQRDDGSYGDVFCNTDCEQGGAYCGYDSGGYDVGFSFEEGDTFKLRSELVTSNDPRHPSHASASATTPQGGAAGSSSDGSGQETAPIVWYIHEAADGTVTEGPGSSLRVVLRLDTTGALFVEGVESQEDLDQLSVPELVQRLTLTDMFSRESPENHGHRPIQTGRVEISLGP